MTRSELTRGILTSVVVLGVFAAAAGAADETVRIWPGAAPGTEKWDVKERKFEVPTKEFGKLLLVTDVTVPTLTVVRPTPADANGTAVIVCPGGGFKFLNWESEGMELARWLAKSGITAFVLKYRVRLNDDGGGGGGKKEQKTFEDALKAGEPLIDIARADAVQAIRHLRANAEKYGIARDRVGLIGFSAGAMTTVSTALKAKADGRPDFAAAVYGAMEDVPVPKDAPPLFIAHTQADAMVPAAQAAKMFNAWTTAGRPAELHLYQAGAHGFGMRRQGLPVDGWADAFEGWLRAGKLLDRRPAAKPAKPADEKGPAKLPVDPTALAVPGKPNLALGIAGDLEKLGYKIEEFFVSGTASTYKLKGEATADGKWEAVPADTAKYTTRIVVVRPSDAKKFSGTAVVEWLNVTGNLDVPVEWNVVHREIVRRGHAYVGVTTQVVGIEGQPGAQRPGIAALKQADPKRYGSLAHPGDAYSFDIFSQAGRLVKDAAVSKVLGPLVPKRILAGGESQGALYLTTYVTAVDPLAKVYDGFLIHSRFGIVVPMDGSALGALTSPLKGVKLRPDLRVPVMVVQAENDVLGWPPIPGTHAARQDDTDQLRVWEMAGTAHADNYTFSVGFIDSGSLPIEKLAAAFAPTKDAMGGKLDEPMNFGPQHHYIAQAALWQLDQWVQTGKAPPKAPPLKLTKDKTPKLVTDDHGLAEGGLRTPWVDVPAARLSGVGNGGGPTAGMVGIGKPFDAATLERLYPGGKADYLKKFEASLEAAIKAGFILPEDKEENLGLAGLLYPSKD